MIEITATTKDAKCGERWVIDGHANIVSKKEHIAAEMTAVFIELWKADKNAFIEAMDMFMECTKND